jgi:hypothetical protein
MKLNKLLLSAFNLNLSHSERTERAKIEAAIPFFLPAVTPLKIRAFYEDNWAVPRFQRLQEQAAAIPEIYRLRREIKATLKYLSRKNEDPIHWQKIYEKTKKLAEAEHLLRKKRLLSMHQSFAMLGSMIKLTLVMGFLLNHQLILPALFSLVALTCLVLLPLYLNTMQDDNEITELVLTAAENAGIQLDITPRGNISDTHSLISLLINLKHDADKIKNITASEIPHDFCCAITHDIMTDPVYSKQNPMRFEREAILNWLEKRAIHPATEHALSPKDLIRDFPLKRRIDAYVDTEIQKHEQALTQLSIFKPEEQTNTAGLNLSTPQSTL